MRIPFTISRAPALISSLRRARLLGHKLNMLTNTGGQNLILVSGGVSVQLSLVGTHHSTSSLSLLPPQPAMSGAVPAPSMHWHLCLHSPLGVRVLPLERDGQMRREGCFSRSPDWLAAAFLCMKKKTKKATVTMLTQVKHQQSTLTYCQCNHTKKVFYILVCSLKI